MVVGEWFPWQRIGRGRMAPRVNRWPMFPHTEVRHCVTFSPFVITNADWTSRHYLVPYLIVIGNGHETSRAQGKLSIVRCRPYLLYWHLNRCIDQHCYEKLHLSRLINWQGALKARSPKSWSRGELRIEWKTIGGWLIETLLGDAFLKLDRVTISNCFSPPPPSFSLSVSYSFSGRTESNGKLI